MISCRSKNSSASFRPSKPEQRTASIAGSDQPRPDLVVQIGQEKYSSCRIAVCAGTPTPSSSRMHGKDSNPNAAREFAPLSLGATPSPVVSSSGSSSTLVLLFRRPGICFCAFFCFFVGSLAISAYTRVSCGANLNDSPRCLNSQRLNSERSISSARGVVVSVTNEPKKAICPLANFRGVDTDLHSEAPPLDFLSCSQAVDGTICANRAPPFASSAPFNSFLSPAAEAAM